MIIDATNLILGRLASFAAKKALLGENVEIINCENAVVTGNKKTTLKDHREKLHKGSSTRGPFTRRRPDRFVKRTIRGMIPYNKEIGKKAMKRIRCYIGTPESLKDQKPMQPQKMSVSKLTVIKYITVKEICKTLGDKSCKQS